jgi:MFS family permease
MASPPAARASAFAALRHRNFRLFWTGQTISLVGTWMQTLAQGWLVLKLTDSAFWVGLVSFVGSVPILIASLPAGVYVDRADKRRLVMAAQALLLIEAALLAVLVATGVVRAWQVAVLAGVVGLVNAVEIPARQSMIVELVGKEDLTNAIALNSSAFNATRVVGPAVAGVIVAKLGLAVCFGLNALSYVAVLLGLRWIVLPPRVRAAPAGDTFEEFREGLRYVRRDRRVLALILATAAVSALGFPYVVLLPVFARDVLGVGADGLGVMTAAVGLGALASALGLAAFGSRVRRGRLVAWAGPAFGVAVAAFAYTRWFPLTLVVLGVTGFAMVLNNAATNTLLQGLVPDEIRGRVMSIWSTVFVGFSPIGALEAGWLASRIGAPAAVAIGGALSAAVAAAIWWRTPEVTSLR